jgi:arabinose-5-phosphate isomerase
VKRSSISVAIEALEAEAAAVKSLIARIGHSFEQVIELMLKAKGRVVVCGMGKSGLVGQKMAATFASTGTPSFFLHPAEALHGDLGMLMPEDIVLLISNSGETDEVLQLLPALRHFGNVVVALTGGRDSTLAKSAHHVLDISVEREICPLNLAPTTSTLVTMAMGDALAVALMDARGFEPKDFARFHPGGSLGRKLLTSVADAMRSEQLPIVTPGTSLRETMLKMTSGRLGLAIVAVDGQLKGILTDGDLRRAFGKEGSASLDAAVDLYMTAKPITVSPDLPFFEAEQIMLEKKIKLLIVTNGSLVKGVVEIFGR